MSIQSTASQPYRCGPQAAAILFTARRGERVASPLMAAITFVAYSGAPRASRLLRKVWWSV